MKATRLGVAVATGALALTTLTPSSAAGGTCWNYRDADRQMAKKINKSRASNGKRKLALDPQLSKVARRHTRSMASEGNLVHTPNLGSKVTHWVSLGENVGFAASVKKLHKMFMASEDHKHNVLNGAFKYVGVGTVKKGDYLWTTIVFESKKNPGTTLKMPKC
jgi:uncharacterized protein YkwD